MAQTPRAGTSNSLCRFRRYLCSILFNYDSNLSLRGTSLIKLLLLWIIMDYFQPQKKPIDLNLSVVTLRFWSFRTPTTFFVPKNCTILVCFRALIQRKQLESRSTRNPQQPPAACTASIAALCLRVNEDCFNYYS